MTRDTKFVSRTLTIFRTLERYPVSGVPRTTTEEGFGVYIYSQVINNDFLPRIKTLPKIKIVKNKNKNLKSRKEKKPRPCLNLNKPFFFFVVHQTGRNKRDPDIRNKILVKLNNLIMGVKKEICFVK